MILKWLATWKRILKFKPNTYRQFVNEIGDVLLRIEPSDRSLYLNQTYFTKQFIKDISKKSLICDCHMEPMNEELFISEIYDYFSRLRHREDCQEAFEKAIDSHFRTGFNFH
jgi:hypothetical protein